MYDDLISSLRICGRINSANDNCIAFHDGSCEAEPVCMYELMGKAADAIENTSKAYNMMAEAYEAEVTRQWWIPVEERLPQICTNVLVAGRMKYRWEHKYLQFVDVAFFNEGEFFETSNDWYEGQDEYEITHWMPIPTPPVAEEGE